MSDNTTIRHSDAELISLEQVPEVKHWTKALGVSEEVLRDAIMAVGNSAGRVRQYLSHAGAVY